jgi:thioredoxin reductase (NADPH)
MSETIRNVIIIGGGPAGYTAAIYAARANLEPLVIAGYQAGGQLMITTEVENYPGFPKGVTGPKLMEDIGDQAKRFGAEMLNEDVTEVDLTNRPFTVKTYDKEFKAHSVIISTGATARWLGLDGEQELVGSGLSACATCDGAFFKEKIVAVVGGGDSAMEEALYLTKHANKVFVIHRRDELRASKIMRERAMNHPKIEILWNKVVDQYHAKSEGFFKKLTHITLKDTQNAETSDLELDGVFVAIGHIPNTNIFKGMLDLDDEGYVLTGKYTQTSLEGVYACGDVVDKRYQQAITAAGDGCRSAIDVERWLAEQGIE